MRNRFLPWLTRLLLAKAGIALLLPQPLAAEEPPPTPAPEAVRVESLTAFFDADVVHALLVGEIALRNGQWAQAVAAFRQAVEQAPDVAELFDRLAQATLLAGDAAQFERTLLLWRWRFPDDPRLATIEAHRDRMQRRFEAQVGEQIAAILKNHPGAREKNLLALPAALAELGDHALILKLIELAVAPYPDEPAAHLILSEAARQTGQMARAQQAAEQALALRSDWPLAWVQWAQVALDRFEAEAAIPALEAAYARHPEERSLVVALALLYAESSTPERAMPLLARWLQQVPEDETLVQLVAELGSQGVAPQAAARLLQQATRHTPHATLHLARLWLHRQQPRRALAVLAPFRPPQPLAEQTAALRAQALARAGQVEAALSLQESIEPLDGPEAAIRAARLYREAKRLSDAREVLTDALARFGDEPQLLYEYALLMERLGDRALAEGYLRKLLALRPFDVHALNALGYLLADANRSLEEAERLILLARRLQPTDGFILDSEGWLRFRQGDLAAARSLLEQAWRRSPDREIGTHLVAVYEALGEHARAAEWRARLKRHFLE